MAFATIEKALEELRKGKIIVVVDDEDRENEGDVICAAEFATPENINFMATYAKGLICMPMPEEYATRLELPPQVLNNTDNHSTAFTVSIDHVDTTTGISAFERSVTAMKSIDKSTVASDFRRPGHMFPLVSKPSGVLERNGHTEATVDLMRLAGLEPVGLCCEIMNDDGSMARLPDLEVFCQKHELVLITIEDLIKYRQLNEVLFSKEADTKLPTKHGEFRIVGFVDKVTKEHHVAVVKGDLAGKSDVLVRVHSECLTGDVFGSARCDCGAQLDRAMQMIEEEGAGAIVYLRQEGRGIGLINKLKAYELQEQGMDTVEANIALGFADDGRSYLAAAQILKCLGVKSVRLLTNNPAKVNGLIGFGVRVTDRLPIEIEVGQSAKNYLKVKKEKMGHILKLN